MRARVNQNMAEYRVAKRYHKLYVPLIELIQHLQDLAPLGTQINSKVELKREDGYINIVYTTKPMELIIIDGKRKFTLKVEE